MFRRFVSLLTLVTLLATPVTSAKAMTVTAEEALFGNGTGVSTGASVQEEIANTLPQITEAPEAAYIADDTYAGVQVSAIDEYPTLQLGDKDTADGTAYIVMMQNRLIALGFLRDSADGTYGENTQTAVEQFQKLNGLERTGIADPATQEKLFSDMSTLVTPSPEQEIAYGSESVRVQTKLIEWGFLIGSADGKLGKKSQQAITDFKQYTYDYEPFIPTPSPTAAPTPAPTPTLAPGEMPIVVDVPIVTPVPTPTPFVANSEVDDMLLSFVDGDIKFLIYSETVQEGSQGAEVKRVQTRLKQLKYLYAEPDGKFGSGTTLALKYFQRKNGLDETGIADEATQRKLFSSEVLKAEEYVFPYKLYVDISDQHVYALGWDGEAYNLQIRKMICSTGLDKTPTPLGTYQSYGKMLNDEWYYFKEFKCYAKWAYGIVGGVLFHSVTYNAQKELQYGSVANLGRKASHGCVRLKEEDAKWIWENCPLGTTVVVQE